MNLSAKRTIGAILSSNFFLEPFSALFPLLPFLLIKSLHATAFQIVLLTMLKPIASIFSFYWSERLSEHRHSLKMSLLGAGLLARIPFLIALCFNNIWFLIIASTLYMLFYRAGIPAWMEILKMNLPDKLREKAFSWGSMLGYAEGVLVAIFFGSFLDISEMSWKILFALSLGFGLIGVIIQALTPVQKENGQSRENGQQNWRTSIIQPWKDIATLMQNRVDFRRFQWAFMIGGLGLMIIQPVIPIFFSQVLHISCQDLMIAHAICKGFGFVLTSPLWSKGLSILSVASFTSLVLLGFALFPLFLIVSLEGNSWLYMAYLIYGIAQAGSHLIWHLSGPIFSRHQDSYRFSGVNIAMAGLRGTIGPMLGGIMVAFVGSIPLFILSMICCLLGTIPLLIRSPERLKKGVSTLSTRV